ncbi:hypothetical protein Hanom_Chr02g00103281 [Helianthus anomalus]
MAELNNSNEEQYVLPPKRKQPLDEHGSTKKLRLDTEPLAAVAEEDDDDSDDEDGGSASESDGDDDFSDDPLPVMMIFPMIRSRGLQISGEDVGNDKGKDASLSRRVLRTMLLVLVMEYVLLSSMGF